MLDYAENIVVSRARSWALETALRSEKWADAEKLAHSQMADAVEMVKWIHARGIKS